MVIFMRINKNIIVQYSLILFGAFLYSVSIALVLSPNRLAPGGVSGIAIIINYLTDFPIGIMTFILNLPLLIISLFKFGRQFFVSTVFAILAGSVFTDLLTTFAAPLTDDYILAAVAGAALNGIGLGIIFRCRATSGGTDIVVRLLKLRYPHLGAGVLFAITDMVIVALSAVVLGDIEPALYAAVCVVLAGIIMDKVLYGTDEAKLVYIISDKSNEITRNILDKLDIGVTFIEGKGAYTNERKDIILCAMKKQRLPQVRELVKSTDERAFMIVTSATEVVGEGFETHSET